MCVLSPQQLLKTNTCWGLRLSQTSCAETHPNTALISLNRNSLTHSVAHSLANMSTMILNIAVNPCNSAKYVCTRKAAASKLWNVSSTLSPAAVTTSIKCSATPCDDQIATMRRSGNYNPSLWDFDYIQSLSSEYRGERYLKKASELVLQVRILLEGEMEDVRRLELTDNLQKLGISYHFDDQIKQILNSMYHDQTDLYSTALHFRLLRQHGFTVSRDVFNRFKNDKGEFKASLAEDTKGLLQLYEASFLLTEGEESLEVAREFSTNLLQKKVDDDGIDDDDLALMVGNALELPLHWRNQRLNARWFIDAYESGPHTNPIVLQLAKLDFNILQATYLEELKHVLRWWEQTSLSKKLPFARDRLVECYAWALGEMSLPQYKYTRIINTKVNILSTLVDDTFDIYGTYQELHAFNNIIQRWDTEAIDQLPYYMQMCFLAVNNFVDEMGYEILKEQGFLLIPYLRKLWAGLCKSYMQEVEWYSENDTPTLEEYIDVAWCSIGGPIILSHEFFAMTNPIKKDAVQSLFQFDDMIRCSSVIIRLANDLVTSRDEMERGDVPKSVECYIKETGGSREEGVQHIRALIRESWKKLNKKLQTAEEDSPFSRDFVRAAADFTTTGIYMYQYGDGLGIQSEWIQRRLSTLLFHPVV